MIEELQKWDFIVQKALILIHRQLSSDLLVTPKKGK